MAEQQVVTERQDTGLGAAEEAVEEVEQTVESELVKPGLGVSPWLLGAAAGSIALAVGLYSRKSKDDAIFVGLWAPTFLALGILLDLLKMNRR